MEISWIWKIYFFLFASGVVSQYLIGQNTNNKIKKGENTKREGEWKRVWWESVAPSWGSAGVGRWWWNGGVVPILSCDRNKNSVISRDAN